MGAVLTGVELRPLAYLVMVCQSSGLNACAQELQIAHSSLSAAIGKLEDTLGLRLFTRNGRRLFPTESALWLFRCALPLLHLEDALRRAAAARIGEMAWVKLDLPLRFIGGRLARAISHAIQCTQADFPGVFVHPCFRDAYVDAATSQPPWQPAQPLVGSVTLTYVPAAEVGAAGRRRLLDDPWVLVTGARPGEPRAGAVPISEMLQMDLAVPRLPRVLLRQVARYCRENALHVSHWSGNLPGSLEAGGKRGLLLPSTITESRLADLAVQVRPLAVKLSSSLCASETIRHPAAERFVAHLEELLGGDCAALRFAPELTLRQFRYLDALQATGNITSAAQKLHIVQPALTAQLRSVEMTLGGPLLKLRQSMDPGRSTTALGSLLGQVSGWMTQQCAEMDRQLAQRAAQPRSGRLRLGVLPTTGQNSALLRAFGDAVAKWRERYPAFALEIVEALHRELVDGVRNQRLHLVVLETPSSWLRHQLLGAPERLGLVANPRLGFEANCDVALEQLTKLPLILPPEGAGIRQILDEAAVERGLVLKPTIESNSMAISLALMRQALYGAVLPLSAVRRDVEAGELTFHPISDPKLFRQLELSHLPGRGLTEAETVLLEMLRAAFVESAGFP